MFKIKRSSPSLIVLFPLSPYYFPYGKFLLFIYSQAIYTICHPLCLIIIAIISIQDLIIFLKWSLFQPQPLSTQQEQFVFMPQINSNSSLQKTLVFYQSQNLFYSVSINLVLFLFVVAFQDNSLSFQCARPLVCLNYFVKEEEHDLRSTLMYINNLCYFWNEDFFMVSVLLQLYPHTASFYMNPNYL